MAKNVTAVRMTMSFTNGTTKWFNLSEPGSGPALRDTELAHYIARSLSSMSDVRRVELTITYAEWVGEDESGGYQFSSESAEYPTD